MYYIHKSRDLAWYEQLLRSCRQVPLVADYDITHGCPYMYLDQKPLYSYGRGTSYARFDAQGWKRVESNTAVNEDHSH